jgi:hypothetical protein
MKCFIGSEQMCQNKWIVTIGAARIFRRRNSDDLLINFHSKPLKTVFAGHPRLFWLLELLISTYCGIFLFKFWEG